MNTDYVYVYGWKCLIERVNLGCSIAMVLEDLEATQDKDIIRILSGEANADLYNPVEETVKKHCLEKNLTIEMIAGPMISVSPDNGYTKNAVVDMAKAGQLNLYRSRIRRELHFRIIENRILRGELPHRPGDYNDRLGFTIKTDELQAEEKEKALFAIENRIKDFEAAKVFCEPVSPEQVEECFVFLTNNQILSLYQRASKEGLSIDRLPKDQIEKMIGQL